MNFRNLSNNLIVCVITYCVSFCVVNVVAEDKIEVESLDSQSVEDIYLKSLYVDYPVESNDSETLVYQKLPELTFNNSSYYDTLGAFIRNLPPLGNSESYEIQFFSNKFSRKQSLVLSRGQNLTGKRVIERTEFRLGFITIDSYKIPVVIFIGDWPPLRDTIYKILKKTNKWSIITSRYGTPILDGDTSYYFEFKDNYKKIVLYDE